jgi:hypothetical protein
MGALEQAGGSFETRGLDEFRLNKAAKLGSDGPSYFFIAFMSVAVGEKPTGKGNCKMQESKFGSLSFIKDKNEEIKRVHDWYIVGCTTNVCA